uniref:Laminin G domain-containing protein n=1 Tax=Timema tahoe TaxID=61484 RepID=A0A7R9IES5_9NEOP|nr:unnamed protein product [Timema tahoe]
MNKVHINVGAGETEVASPKGLRLDDLAWHEVAINRREAAFTLQVDVIHTVNLTKKLALTLVRHVLLAREKLPGNFFELNIHYGLFLGGQGDFSELFLGHLESLRGCLADVRYNGVNVLTRARERQGKVDVQGITWSCAPEFDADLDREISFVEEGGFVALPNAITRTGARWHFELKTVSERGILLYNTGLGPRPDFVGLELVNGQLRLLLDKGNGAIELLGDRLVSDGDWHSVEVQFNPTFVELLGDRLLSDGRRHSLEVQFNPTFVEVSVDGAANSLRLPQGGSRYLDLADTAFLGGLELNKRARAMNQGLRAADASFKGCLRKVEVDGRRLGIPDARVTQGIVPDCVWEFPCAGEPCVAGAQCVQQGVDSFRCECDQPLCVKPDYADTYTVFSKPTLAIDLEILSLTPLQVAEGDNCVITTNNVDLVLDFPKYGVRDSGVLFHVLETPQHGKLAVTAWDRGGVNNPRQTFTLLDLAKDKVRYVHDGSENHDDTMVFDLELTPGPHFVLPSYLQGRHRFALHVNVTPVNDPPILILQPGAALRLAQGTRKSLTRDLLHALDPDSSGPALVYSVLSQGVPEPGHVERLHNPGVPIRSFTQQDVDQGQVVYAHSASGAESGRLTMEVSDGIETSPPVFLRLSAFPLQLRLVNNTGLIITRGVGTLITSANLGFDSNADDPDLDVRYDIVKTPQFGVVQRLRGDAQWQSVDHFTGHQLARDQIRYLHLSGEPAHDEFKRNDVEKLFPKYRVGVITPVSSGQQSGVLTSTALTHWAQFKVSLLEVHSPILYDFRVTFTELQLVCGHTRELQLNGTREGWLTNQHLLFQTEPLSTDTDKIVYHVSRTPHYGALHAKHRRLQAGDTFTQQDLDSIHLRYRLHRKAYSHVRDDFSFMVSAPECDPVPGSLTLLHVPSGDTRSKVQATLERLQVPEGGRQSLLPTHLHLETRGITELVYNVTHGPHHGRLDVLDVGLLTELRKNTQYFSSRELITERVFYVHDDSETRRDSFHFVALSSEEEDFQYVGVFHVDVLLKNDNTPERAVDKVFHVVALGEKLLTGRDLRYSDADIDTRPSDIVYTRRGIQNGGIYKASDPSVPLYEFSQDDLNNRRVLFRHEGEEYSKVGLWITDGQFYANGVLEVRASPPFVEITNNTGLVVKRGGITPITSANLSGDTNLNLWGEKIQFEVLEGPVHGHVEIDHQDGALGHFTQLDLEEGHLFYHHDNSVMASDKLKFKVMAGKTSAESKLNIKVFPSSYWEPLVVSNNHTLHVEESTSIAITADMLKVMRSGIPATDITYYVTERPAFGYLELEVLEGAEEPTESAVDVFDQATIDDGRLVYVQAVANHSKDHFVVDVTNGVTWLRGRLVNLVVVPERLYLSSGEVKRAARQALTGDGGVWFTGFPSVSSKPKENTYQHEETAASISPLKSKGKKDDGGKVAEGATIALPPGVLSVMTDYYRGRVTEYRVADRPKSGILQSLREPGTVINKFTLAQLEAGIIQYTHDGSETQSDQMVVVGIAGEKESVPTYIKVTITPINDEPPQVVNNTGLDMWKGAMIILDRKNLAATDKDTPAENLTFIVITPRFGHLVFVAAPTFPIERFTQAHINSHKVAFVHTGGDGGVVTFTVTDGVHTSIPFNFPVTSHKVNLQLSSKSLLHVFPLRRQTVTQSQLLATASDPTRTVIYAVNKRPALGHLTVESQGKTQEAVNFTQQDVNTGRLHYQHTHPFFGLSTNDSFGFNVLADFAEPLLEQELYIDISISSGGLDQFLDIPLLDLDEGKSVPLRLNISSVVAFLEAHADIDSPVVTTQLVSQPRHGELAVAGDTNITNFGQDKLDSGEIVYRHDGSDTTSDEMSFSLILEPGSVLLCNVSIPVVIRPVNDQPFRLATPAPLIAVVQGQNYTLTKRDLLTEDPDTEPEGLLYDIISGPSQGRLLLYSNYTNSTLAMKFSQADIDSGRIMYEHSGSLQPATFYFRVWDGHFNPVYTVFNIHVIPLMLNVSVISVVLLQQGSSVAFITTEHMHIITNGDRNEVRYNITRAPRHGNLFVREVATNIFSQLELEAKTVMYMQTDMTTANDSFQMQASLGGMIMEGLEIRVVVTPLLSLGNFTPLAGTRNKLGLHVLDASPLAKWTNSNPTFRVLRRPRLGRIKKIIRSSGERRQIREREVSKFSHEELRSGVIYYVAKHLAENTESQDDFPFLLAASIFQPALGELHFTVYPERIELSQSSIEPPLADPKDPVGRESGHDHMVATSPNMSSDYVLIVSMVLGVVLLAMMVIVIVKCRSVRAAREESHRCKTDPALTRSPDELRPPSPPRPKRFAPHTPSPTPIVPPLPVPNSMLQCKVIPLEPVESVASSDVDLNARYPYGVADEPVEDWSSYEASELAYPARVNNPMLRRNQYWV